MTTAAPAGDTAAKPAKGLQDVVAAESTISDVDGQTGVLLYRGYAVADLADNATYEEVVHLLLEGKLPNQSELYAFHQQLTQNRSLPAVVLEFLGKIPAKTSPMSALRTAVSLLGSLDADGDLMSQITKDDRSRLEHEKLKVRRLTAQLPTIVCAFHRLRHGQAPIAADPALSHAANFLYMLSGKKPTAAEERAFDLCLTLHAEHGLNASTFACRVTVATLSDVHSAVVSGIGALKGPLHGGANEEVMKMLLEIQSHGGVAKAEEWVRGALAAKRKIMGFGHRVYKVYDPRALILREWSRKLGEQKGEPHWFQITEIVEKLVSEAMSAKGSKIHPNVDFFSATVYHHLGIPADLFTPIFAVGRIAGWCAHIMEQLADNRLIRPESDYIGPRGLKVLPIAQRS